MARQFNNIPQSKDPNFRINCAANDGNFKAHSMIMQGSRNFFQWRVKRGTKTGHCTLRLSSDGLSFHPLTPVGKSNYRFACGKSSGYESAEIVMPKRFVNEHGAILQLEFEHELGTAVQCGDIII